MSSTTRGRTTTSVEGIPSFDVVSDPTPGLALIYSRLHAHLPSAVPFAAPIVTLGRESKQDVVIPDMSVSRFHAFAKPGPDGALLLQDAGSTNGTTVNGQSVPRRRSPGPGGRSSGAPVPVGGSPTGSRPRSETAPAHRWWLERSPCG